MEKKEKAKTVGTVKQNNNDKANEKNNENKNSDAYFKEAFKSASEKDPKMTGEKFAESKFGKTKENKTSVETERADLPENKGKREMNYLDGKMMTFREKIQQVKTMLNFDVHEAFARGSKGKFIHGEGFRKKGLRMKTTQKALDVTGQLVSGIGESISGGYQRGQGLLHRR